MNIGQKKCFRTMNTINRYDLAYMDMTCRWAELSYATRLKVGTLIVKDTMVISDGFNGMPTGMSNTCEDENDVTNWEVLHAEANAILKLAKYGSGGCKDATLYTSHSPCKECSKLIHQSGIKRVFYKNEYKDTDGIEFLQNMGVEVIHIKYPS